ncbi:MAG: MmgE/PrpD family protein [Hyphomicrobiaceae bacterium]
MTYLDELARFAAQTPTAALPQAVMDRTKLIIADCIAAIVGGNAEPEMAAMRTRANMQGAGPSLLLGTRQGVTASQAALLNGTAGTFLEMDEGQTFSKGHPGMHTVPAALAFAQSEQITGADFIAAVAIGYDVGARVGIGSSLRLSMHPHGTWGAINAATAVARLAGYDSEKMKTAINIAATLGLATSRRTMLEGGTVRNVFSGVSNQMGILTNDMIESGFCGEVDGVAHVYGNVVSESFCPEAVVEQLGQRWEVTRNYFKMHSCCRFNHASLDALNIIETDHPGKIRADNIQRIAVDTYSLAVELDDPHPKNTLAGKFSLPFSLATTIVNGSSGVGSFTGDQIARDDILALAEKVTIREGKAMSAKLPAQRPAKVAITLIDGQTLEAATDTNRGDWADPYQADELYEKYISLTERLWTTSGARAVHQEIMALDASPTLERMNALMREAVRTS